MPKFPVLKIYTPEITSGYGLRKIGNLTQFHPGIDIIAHGVDPKIQCAYSGTIEHLGWSETYGNRIWVKVGRFYHIYAHLKELNPELKEGNRIMEGDYIGIMGNTGLILHKGKLVTNKPDENGVLPIPLPYGQHLHYGIMEGVKIGSKSIEPFEIIHLIT
jgi:murein DD-endopeptidase MepM/ murein hydrolase activator NlpD